MTDRPIDPYSPDWPAYWAAHPHLHRGVGADAVQGTEGTEGGGAKAADDGTKGNGLSEEEQAAATAALNRDWTADLPDDLKETGKRFASKADAVRAIVDFRKRESQVRVPGKDATPEQINAYHKAIGVPEKPDDYEFFTPEGAELTEAAKAERGEWAKRFHALGIGKEAAVKLTQFVSEDNKKLIDDAIAADKKFVADQEAALKAEWKGEEYDRNKTVANRAFAELAKRTGLNLEDLTRIETKDGRFLMDRADMVRIFAAIGREMAEGSLGPTLTESEKETMDEQVRNLRAQIGEAQASGDSKRANRLYQQEQALLAKRSGSRPVVGSGGRVA